MSSRSYSQENSHIEKREMLGVLPVRSLGVLLTLYGNKFERELVVGPLKLYFNLKLISIKG